MVFMVINNSPAVFKAFSSYLTNVKSEFAAIKTLPFRRVAEIWFYNSRSGKGDGHNLPLPSPATIAYCTPVYKWFVLLFNLLHLWDVS